MSPEQLQQFAVALALGMGRDLVVAPVSATGSMRPFFGDNALLLLEAAPYNDLRVGDVVTYWDEDRQITVVHRLVRRQGDEFWARGDHNPNMDRIFVTRKNYRRRLAGVIYGSSACTTAGSSHSRAKTAASVTTDPAKAGQK